MKPASNDTLPAASFLAYSVRLVITFPLFGEEYNRRGDDLSDEQVASFFINPAAAIAMVRHVLAIPRGEWLLQSAAGSELGRMIIRLARHETEH